MKYLIYFQLRKYRKINSFENCNYPIIIIIIITGYIVYECIIVEI